MPVMTGCRLGRAAVRGRSSSAGKRAALPGKKDALAEGPSSGLWDCVWASLRSARRACFPGGLGFLCLLPFTLSLGDSAPASFTALPTGYRRKDTPRRTPICDRKVENRADSSI